jgi:hypothetical protein
MKHYIKIFFAFKIFLIVGLNNLFGQNNFLPVPDSIIFSHGASIEILRPGILPNLDTLTSSKLIVVSAGGKYEGSTDNILWYLSSIDSGASWSQFKVLTDEDIFVKSDTLARDLIVFFPCQ